MHKSDPGLFGSRKKWYVSERFWAGEIYGQSNILECVVLLWCIMWLEMGKERGREPDVLHISVIED